MRHLRRVLRHSAVVRSAARCEPGLCCDQTPPDCGATTTESDSALVPSAGRLPSHDPVRQESLRLAEPGEGIPTRQHPLQLRCDVRHRLAERAHPALAGETAAPEVRHRTTVRRPSPGRPQRNRHACQLRFVLVYR